MFSCTDCDYTTPRKSELNCPMKRHANTPVTPNLPPKVARHELNPNIDPPTNDHLHEELEQQEIQAMLEQNTQCGLE